MKVHRLLAACALIAPLAARAQSAPPIATTVAAAEAEGKRHSRDGSPPDGLWRYTNAVGSADRVCVTPAEPAPATPPARAEAIGPPARSGEFVIGAQISGDMRLTAGRGGKIWWASVHKEVPILVRGARIGAPADTVRYVFETVAWNPGARSETFTPSTVMLPNAGTWLLVATSGQDWGCFLVSTR